MQIRLLFTVIGLFSVGLLLWWVLGPTIRFAAKLLTVFIVASAAALASALLLGQSAEDQIGWAVVGFFTAAVVSAGMIRRREQSPVESWTREPSVAVRPSVAVPAGESDSSTTLDDTNRPLRRLDRLGLTKAARARREAARIAAESALVWTELTSEAQFAINRIAVARRSCEHFTKETGSTPSDTEVLAHLVVLQKRVPEIIRRRLTLSAVAGPAERRRLLEDLVDQLEQIAAEGERRLSRREPVHIRELETERAYLKAYFDGTKATDA